MVLSFGVVFFLLAKFGFPVIVKAINERKEFIEMSLLSAKQAKEKLAGIQAESEKLLADAKAQQKDIIAYSTLTGVFAAGDPAFLYIDESLKGKDLPDFISVSCGGFPSDFGLGDNNSVYRVRLFDGLTSKCLKHIHYYDKLPEDMRHYLPHTSTPPMVGC